MSTDTPRVGAAVSWAFDTFRRYPVPFIALAAVVAVLQTVLNLATQPFITVINECATAQSPGQQLACESALSAANGVATITAFVVFVAGIVAQIGVMRGALAASRGQRPEFAMLWSTENLGRYLGTLALTVVFIGVGLLLCLLPGFVAAFLLQLSTIFALDRGLRPMAAIKASAAVVRANVGPALLMVLFVFLVSMLSGALWGLLTLLTLPFVTLFLVHMYRQFNADPVA